MLRAFEADASREAGDSFLALVARYLEGTRAGDGPVSTSLPPAALAARFDEPLPVGGLPLEEVVERVERDVVADANRLMHPMSMGHQVSPPLPAAIWTDALISAINQSVAVSEMSPTGTAIETTVVRWMCALAGWGAGAGGTLTSGGTEATFTALLAARAAALPDAWEEGVGDDPPVVLCGEHSHYAVTRAVGELGLGMRRAIAIPSRGWRMDAGALAAALERLGSEGRRVMAVVATAGSTATGSFDDLDAIGELCERHGVWLHVDGAHGASALLSPSQRHRLRGIERARSIAWDPHKMMLMPLPAGMLLVREERDLERAFAQRAPYLFHGAGAAERVWDQGVRSFMCSRRADAIKVWVALQRYGADGIGALYDHLCATTRALHAQIAARGDFEALHEPESNILCFRYTGPHAPHDGDPAAADDFQRELRERWNRSGRGWITATVLGGRRVLRVTIMNPRTTPAHTAAMLAGLAEMAAGMAAERQAGAPERRRPAG
ncbi:MAG TPA: pyridoxal-dependent decarboxylase [Gemmatimonadaceae bacterium]|nr:pyridoxal-dependent decarboxylase [Gemmatimonadaceae bacterium]